MSTDQESPQLRGAKKITANDLISATSMSTLRAMKEREIAQDGPLNETIIEILIGLILGDG